MSRTITVRIDLDLLATQIAGTIATVIGEKGIGLVASSGRQIRAGDGLEAFLAECGRNAAQHVANAEIDSDDDPEVDLPNGYDPDEGRSPDRGQW